MYECVFALEYVESSGVNGVGTHSSHVYVCVFALELVEWLGVLNAPLMIPPILKHALEHCEFLGLLYMHI